LRAGGRLDLHRHRQGRPNVPVSGDTTAEPFTGSLKTSGKGKLSLKIRNYVVCKLR
jgi:hypothetical protein